MKTLTIRDFRTRPKEAQRTLASEGEAVLTANGRPVAVMLKVDGETLDETVETIRRARALQALREIRKQAKASGLDRLRPKEIQALITKVRRERARRSAE